MKKILIAIVITSMSSLYTDAWSDEIAVCSKTIAPDSSRYEIVQSNLAAVFTFRLDKYTGEVKQLVRTTGDGTAWQRMEVFQLPKTSGSPKVRYQIFTSGLAARHTFLLNIDTGFTWILTSHEDENKGKDYSWSPFEYQ